MNDEGLTIIVEIPEYFVTRWMEKWLGRCYAIEDYEVAQ